MARSCIGGAGRRNRTTPMTRRSKPIARATTPQITYTAAPRPTSGKRATGCRFLSAGRDRSRPAVSGTKRFASPTCSRRWPRSSGRTCPKTLPVTASASFRCFAEVIGTAPGCLWSTIRCAACSQFETGSGSWSPGTGQGVGKDPPGSPSGGHISFTTSTRIPRKQTISWTDIRKWLPDWKRRWKPSAPTQNKANLRRTSRA